MNAFFRSITLLIAMIPCRFAYCGEKGLVAQYSFDEGSSAVARDVSGHRNDGKIHGAKSVPAGKGRCLQFDGEDDYVDCGHGQSLNLTDQITLEAWIKPDSVPAGEPGIIGRGTSFDANWGITYFKDGVCYFYVSAGANNCLAKLAPGSWHHVAATFDGSRSRLYIDGNECGRRKMLSLTKINNDGEVLIGRNGAFHFKGLIDDVRIYNGALSPGRPRFQV